MAFASQRRLPIIVDAGRVIPSLGRDALELARAYPRVPLILADAAFSDLAWIWTEATSRRNLLFDTAWWNMAASLALFTLIPAGQILFASDLLYGRRVAAVSVALRAGLWAGLNPEQIRRIAGGQLERLLAGAEPLDLGPAPMRPARPAGQLLERVHTLVIAAAGRLTDGHPGRVPRAGTAGVPDSGWPSGRAGRPLDPGVARPPRCLRGQRSTQARPAGSPHSPDLRRCGGRPDTRPAAPRPQDTYPTGGRSGPFRSAATGGA